MSFKFRLSWSTNNATLLRTFKIAEKSFSTLSWAINNATPLKSYPWLSVKWEVPRCHFTSLWRINNVAVPMASSDIYGRRKLVSLHFLQCTYSVTPVKSLLRDFFKSWEVGVISHPHEAPMKSQLCSISGIGGDIMFISQNAFTKICENGMVVFFNLPMEDQLCHGG